MSLPSSFKTRRVVLMAVALAVCSCLSMSQIPGIQIGPIKVTPVGVFPTPVVNKANDTINQVAPPVVTAAGDAAKAVGTTLIAPQVHVIRVIAGQESLGDAAGKVVQSQGDQIVAVSQAVSATNAAVANVQIIAAGEITGDVGKTIMTVGTGANRLQVEFATTAAMQSGNVLNGKLSPEVMVAAPLAAAIRAAQQQFSQDAKELPPEVKAQMAPYYPAEVLNSARWTVGSISLSVPDVTNQFRKIEGVDNAVTVGNITVFVRDPGTSYHWWAHELQHQVQYRNWGIDTFAYKYVTSCHEVETDAENKAVQVVPINGTASLGC